MGILLSELKQASSSSGRQRGAMTIVNSCRGDQPVADEDS
jgi:hypothetical protein